MSSADTSFKASLCPFAAGMDAVFFTSCAFCAVPSVPVAAGLSCTADDEGAPVWIFVASALIPFFCSAPIVSLNVFFPEVVCVRLPAAALRAPCTPAATDAPSVVDTAIRFPAFIYTSPLQSLYRGNLIFS